MKRVVLTFGFLLCFATLPSSLALAQDCGDEDTCGKPPANVNVLTGLAGGLAGIVIASFVTLLFGRLHHGSSQWDAGITEDVGTAGPPVTAQSIAAKDAATGAQ